jgi:hypothetical protein
MYYEASWIVFPQNLGMWGLCQTFDVKQAHSKVRKMFLCGVSERTKGYYFYNKAEGKVFAARNGVFMEKEILSKGVSGSNVQLEKIQETPENVLAPTDPIQEVQDVVSPDVYSTNPT